MDDSKKQYLLQTIEDNLALGRTIPDTSRRLRAIASDDEIEEIVSEFKNRNSTIKNSKTINTLVDNKELESWYVCSQ
jgi:hypothetical protein